MTNSFNIVHRYLFAITILFSIGIIAPTLFSEGMFVDGLIYASISRNIAEGIGSFWVPHFSKGLFNEFYQHPPLAFGVQSIFFSLFGDSWRVEKLYCLTLYIFTEIGIIILWKYFSGSYYNAWIPIFLWMTIEDVRWGFSNNLLELTMGIFVLISAIMLLKYIHTLQLWWVVGSGLFLSMAMLTKGFTSLYVWTIPFFHSFIFKKENLADALKTSCILITITLLPIFLFYWFSEEANQFMKNYISIQVVDSIKNQITVSSRFIILWKFLQNIIIPLFIVFITIYLWIKKNKKDVMDYLKLQKKNILFLLLIVLSGILPIMISKKQSGFYILTTYPFFSVACGLWINQYLHKIINKHFINSIRILKRITIIFLILVISVSFYASQRIGRDEALIQDCKKIISIVGKESTIGIPSSLFEKWSLHAYFARYGNVSLINNSSIHLPYIITEKDTKFINEYQRLPIQLNCFILWEKYSN